MNSLSKIVLFPLFLFTPVAAVIDDHLAALNNQYTALMENLSNKHKACSLKMMLQETAQSSSFYASLPLDQRVNHPLACTITGEVLNNEELETRFNEVCGMLALLKVQFPEV